MFDPDALAEAVSACYIEHVQIERGEFMGELKRLSLGVLSLDSGCYTRKLLARGEFSPGSAMLGCVLDSHEDGCLNGYRIARNDIAIFPKGKELEYILPAATHWCAFPLSDSVLTQAGVQDLRIDQIKVMPGSRILIWVLRELLGYHPADCRGGGNVHCSPTARAEVILYDQIAQLLQNYCGDSDVRRPSREQRMVMIREFASRVEERIDRKLCIPQLCSEMGVNHRTLELVFKQDLGLTPKQFSDSLRLNSLRQALLRRRSCDPKIKEIASHCGISHLGRLSAAYRQQFGELPSDTLRQ